ncbi:MAG: methyltransferase domain-containing protein [Candidatus Zixiibacteriota bacterium]|nr:MAG: methyltransferase domain-containing protein [candidate division Zixibacteria bacterium]
MYDVLQKINTRPRPFEFYTAEILWTDEHISRQMLAFHLSDDTDLASRKKAFIDKSVEWMTTRFDIGKNTRIADFGCGPGLYSTRLAEKGAEVTGIDFSERSIDYARKAAEEKQLNIDYIHQDYLEFKSDRKFDLITMIYCDLCPLSPWQRKVMLGKFRDLLDDEGFVVLDVCSLNTFNQKNETATYGRKLLDGFWSSEDYYGFLNTFKYEEEKVILDKYTIIEKSRTREIYNWIQCFSRESIRKEFEGSGLQIIEFYSDVAGTPYRDDSTEIAIVAKKA